MTSRGYSLAHSAGSSAPGVLGYIAYTSIGACRETDDGIQASITNVASGAHQVAGSIANLAEYTTTATGVAAALAVVLAAALASALAVILSHVSTKKRGFIRGPAVKN